jgi:PncC family amidohydrolase
MATAESCTGGAIASACTSLAGSSAWFEGGVVSYSNPAKVSLLGVEPATLERCGAVSAEVVEQMAAALRIISGRQQCIDNLMSNADVANAALSSWEAAQ